MSLETVYKTMTIGMSNASSKARNCTVITNINQGGGDKKAGFPYQIGRSSASSIVLKSTDPIGGKCCTLKALQTLRFHETLGTLETQIISKLSKVFNKAGYSKAGYAYKIDLPKGFINNPV